MFCNSIKPILIFFILILSSVTIYSQKINVDSPVFIGALLIDRLDEEDMAETCRYYKLVEREKEGGFSVFKADDGTKIRFKVVDSSPIDYEGERSFCQGKA